MIITELEYTDSDSEICAYCYCSRDCHGNIEG